MGKMNYGVLSILISVVFLFGLTACGNTMGQKAEDDMGYQQIDQQTALQMMEREDGHIILDVRTREEYEQGHIPGAVLIPNETIGRERPQELRDLEQVILVYCRSGNRSRQAAGKLAKLGYTKVYEFGGINTWPGKIVTGNGD